MNAFATGRSPLAPNCWINVPAVLISGAVTWLLIIGTTESARVYDDLARAYRARAAKARRPVRLESSAAVRKACQS